MPLLSVRSLKQAKGSNDCGLVCLQMIAEFNGQKVTLETLKKQIKVYSFGTYAPQLGIWFSENGYTTELIVANPKLFTVANHQKSSKDIHKHITMLKGKKHEGVNKNLYMRFDTYLSGGGSMRVEIPSVHHIETAINAGSLVIALMTTNFLTAKMPSFNFHFVVVCGYDNDSFFIKDPIKGDMTWPKEYFMFGLHVSSYGDADNGSLLIVKK